MWSFLFIINLDTLGPCFITLPLFSLSRIKFNIPIFWFPWVKIKDNSFLLFTKKQPSPSVKPINQVRKLSSGNLELGKFCCPIIFKN